MGHALPGTIAAPADASAISPVIRVLIADDHPLVRRGLAAIINMEEDA